MDNKLVNSVYEVLKDDPKVASKNKQSVINTLLCISQRILQDTYKTDTLSVLNIYCTMNGIKNTFKPNRVYSMTRSYTEED